MGRRQFWACSKIFTCHCQWKKVTSESYDPSEKKFSQTNFVHIREKKAREYTFGLTDPSHAIESTVMDSKPAPMPK
jgi:hypothetical protein